MTGVLNPKSSDKKKIRGRFFLRDSRGAPRPWRGFSSAGSGFIFFHKHTSFWERSYAPKLRKNQEKKVVHFYRRKRHG